MFCNIVFPIPLQQKFVYFLPEQIIKQFSNNEIRSLVGSRAIVDFGPKKDVIGVIVDVKEKVEFDKNIKPVKTIFDTKPLFSFEQLEFAKKIANKYFVSLGMVLNQFFPYEEKVKFTQSIIVSQNVKRVKLDVNVKYLEFIKDKKLLVFDTINEKFLFYTNIIFDIINKEKQLIILFPSNVYLIDFWKFLLKNINGESVLLVKSKVMLYTGELPVKERFRVWQLLRNKQINVVLATKVGAFLPFENVTNVVIDEADSLGYKNQEVPMYHACDIVQERVKTYNIVLNYSFFIPSAEFFYKNRKSVKFIKSCDNLAKIKVVKGELKKIILENIYKFKQTVVIFPYKGYARFCVCCICKHKIPIKKMVSEGFLCPKCGSKYYELRGTGIQKFVQKLYDINKNLTIEYIDSTLNTKKIEKIINDFNNEKIDVLVATPLLFNYIYRISFANVKSVYFVCLDSLLYSGSYLCYENVYRFITLCKVLLNSYNIADGEICLEIFHQKEYNDVLLSEIKVFFKKELKIRKELCFPPFCEVIKITLVSKNKNKLEDIIDIAKEKIRSVYLIEDIISEDKMFKVEIFIKMDKNFEYQMVQIKELILSKFDVRFDKVYVEYNPVL